jgi:hypothetical protein
VTNRCAFRCSKGSTSKARAKGKRKTKGKRRGDRPVDSAYAYEPTVATVTRAKEEAEQRKGVGRSRPVSPMPTNERDEGYKVGLGISAVECNEETPCCKIIHTGIERIEMWLIRWALAMGVSAWKSKWYH